MGTRIMKSQEKVVDIVSRSMSKDGNLDKTEVETTLHDDVIADIQPWTGNVAQVPAGAIDKPTHMIFTKVSYTDVTVHNIVKYSNDEYKIVFVYDYKGHVYYLARKQ